MREINQNDLDTAIALGDAVCDELGICCDKRGRVIYQIYRRLQELKPQKETTGNSETDKAHAEQNSSPMTGTQPS